jgi:uncharacterized protein YbjT (DUF2867 family)
MRRILVLGASGRTGTQVVQQAIARGDAVTAFVRSTAKAAHLPKAARVVTGDGLVAQDVAAAMPGHDTVVVAVGDGRVFVSAAIIRNVIAAMKANGVKRVVLLSAYGIGDSGHGLHGFVIRRVMPKLNADKMESERLLAESGLDWTSVRPPVLTTAPAKGYRAAANARINGFGRLSRADLAAFMLKAIDDNSFVRQAPSIAAA